MKRSPMLALLLLVMTACAATFCIGVYAGYARAWPLSRLKILVANHLGDPDIQTDRFGRLRRYPGKNEIACPLQDEATAVLLVAGQSNAANAQGQRYESPDDRVVNFFEGRCYRAASPLLGADGRRGESWTLLGTKLVRAGLYNSVILVPAAVGGSPIRRWVAGGDLSTMLTEVIRATKGRYTITGVLWDQGATDFALRTPEDRYRSELKSLIDQVRAEGVTAPFFITRCSVGGEGWTEDNPIARAQAALADGKTIFDGPNTDHDVTPFDRYDGYHFSASGQEKWTDTWVQLLQAHGRAK
ncbi:MAG TPA: sialate O-acetylesterase [Rhodopila sp.]